MPWKDIRKTRKAQADWHRRRRAEMTPAEYALYRDSENERFRKMRAEKRRLGL